MEENIVSMDSVKEEQKYVIYKTESGDPLGTFIAEHVTPNGVIFRNENRNSTFELTILKNDEMNYEIHGGGVLLY